MTGTPIPSDPTLPQRPGLSQKHVSLRRNSLNSVETAQAADAAKAVQDS